MMAFSKRFGTRGASILPSAIAFVFEEEDGSEHVNEDPGLETQEEHKFYQDV